MTIIETTECPDCGHNHPYPCADGTCDCCDAIDRERLDGRNMTTEKEAENGA